MVSWEKVITNTDDVRGMQLTCIILCDDIHHYVTYRFLFTENACEKRLKISNGYSGRCKFEEGQTIQWQKIYITLHRKLQIEQHEPH
jgi:hypothetical protein